MDEIKPFVVRFVVKIQDRFCLLFVPISYLYMSEYVKSSDAFSALHGRFSVQLL